MTRKRLSIIGLWILALAICGFQAQNFPGVGLATSSGGTTNSIPKFTATSVIGNSALSDNATSVTSTEPIIHPAGTTAVNSIQFTGLGATYGIHQGSGAYIFSANNADIMQVNANAPIGLNILPGAQLSITPAAVTAGADGTVNDASEVRRVVYKITVSGSTCVSAGGFIAAALNADCVIATFPAKTQIARIVVDNTIGFTCSSVCTGTKTVQVGKTSGGTEFLLAKDATVIATYGLVNGDLGASLATSATTPVGGGDIPSWTATTTIRARYVSGTGNWGTGAATTVNAGSTTFYIETLVFP